MKIEMNETAKDALIGSLSIIGICIAIALMQSCVTTDFAASRDRDIERYKAGILNGTERR